MKKGRLIKVIFLSVISFTTVQIISKPTGAPQAAAGAPAEGGATCAQGGCHAGSATAVSNVITNDIPAAGYTPGTTYNITVTVTGSGWKGFMISPQNSTGTYLGTLISGAGSKTVFTKYITHSTDKSPSPAVWALQWKAPAAGAGDVTFYGAFAISLYTTQKQALTVHENTSGGIPPVVSTLASNNITSHSATLNGSINTNGRSYSAAFQYKTPTSSWVMVGATPATVSSSSATNVSLDVSGLPSNTTITYKVCAWNPGDTAWGTAQTFNTSVNTGIAGINRISSLNIFPNPAASDLNLTFNLDQKADIRINLTSMDGKTVYALYKNTLSAGNQELKLDVKDMRSGIYFLQVQMNDQTTYQKVLIDRY